MRLLVCSRVLNKCNNLVTPNCKLASAASAKKTCLTDLHSKHGASFAPFAGYKMPTVYADQSITQSTLHTRKHASIFDVSHMLQSTVKGKDASGLKSDCIRVVAIAKHHFYRIAFMESLTTVNLQALKNGRGSLTVFTNDKGGIEDDLIVSRVSDHELYVVTNAGCIEGDVKIMQANLAKFKSEGRDVDLTHMHDHGLIALQGPEAVKVIQKGVDIDLGVFYFMQTTETELFGIKSCRITRCGYTGEDGFEISVAPEKAEELCSRLLDSKQSQVKLAGLGARDALRLEAGLCLYGNDIDQTTSIVEADLTWLLGKRRRELGDFPGSETVLSHLKNKMNLKRLRVGFTAKEGGRPPRGHAAIIDEASGAQVGEVTSGCPSPCLGYNIGQAYVKPSAAKPGTKLVAVVGKSKTKIEVAKMPFLKTGYYAQPKKPKF